MSPTAVRDVISAFFGGKTQKYQFIAKRISIHPKVASKIFDEIFSHLTQNSGLIFTTSAQKTPENYFLRHYCEKIVLAKNQEAKCFG